ncbi:MAG TPA: hypothetical protein VGD67_19730 [Pseudonocardiaceae bacterium]
MTNPSQAGPRKALEYLQQSELANLDIPVSRLVDSARQLEEVAGYILLWERYVLVVADPVENITNPVVER